jgi:hypothetical protein
LVQLEDSGSNRNDRPRRAKSALRAASDSVGISSKTWSGTGIRNRPGGKGSVATGSMSSGSMSPEEA